MATSETEVRDMMASTYGNVPADADLSPYVDAANLIVSEADLSDLSSTRQDLIATFLGCHFATIALFNSGIIKKTVGESSETYSTPNGKEDGLKVTHWGKQAMALDTTGTLQETYGATNSLPGLFTVYTGREYYEPEGARADGVQYNDT